MRLTRREAQTGAGDKAEDESGFVFAFACVRGGWHVWKSRSSSIRLCAHAGYTHTQAQAQAQAQAQTQTHDYILQSQMF